MIIEETLRKLNEMKMYGMVKSITERRIRPDHQDLSIDDWLSLIVDDEYLFRTNKRTNRLIQNAKLKHKSACLEDIDYQHKRGLVKSKILSLQNNQWVEKHQNLIITGPTGIGKSHLACAFGNWACRHGYSVLYFRWSRLFGDFLAAHGDGTYLRYLKKLSKVNVLIVDDFGSAPLSDSDRKDFMELIEDRYQTASTVFTSQLPIKYWHEYIGDPTISDAICDRIIHLSHTFELKGDSLRPVYNRID